MLIDSLTKELHNSLQNNDSRIPGFWRVFLGVYNLIDAKSNLIYLFIYMVICAIIWQNAVNIIKAVNSSDKDNKKNLLK